MFCPNCGTQNPDTAQTCSKCNFNLKGAAAPKFKGTMLMQQAPQIPGAPAPGAPAPAPAPNPATAPAMPSKLKGTMVGVAPPMPGSAPMGPPADAGFPPPGGGGGGGMGGYGAPPQQPPMAEPPPAHNTFGSPQGVNPLGGTMVAPDGMSGGFGAPPPQQGGYGAPQGGYGGPPQGGGYGDPNAGGFGAPPPQQGGYGAPQQGGYGAPQGGYGAPPQGGGYGAPPPQDFGQQMQQGFNQASDAISHGINQALGGGYAPTQQPYGGQGGAMQPYPGGPMMQGGMQGMQAGPPGAHGPKGQVKNPLTSALLVAFVPFYGIIWFIGVCNEISAYLQRDEPKWVMVMLLSMVTCGLYGLYWMIMKLGPLVAEMQQRAGVPAENRGIMYWIPIYGVMCLHEDLNKVWQSPN